MPFRFRRRVIFRRIFLGKLEGIGSHKTLFSPSLFARSLCLARAHARPIYMPAALLLTASAVASSSDVEALTKANGGEAPAVATRSTALSPSDFSAAASVASSSSFSLVRSLAASGHASAEGAGVLRVAAAALAPGGTLELAEEVRERERENGRNGSIGKKKKTRRRRRDSTRPPHSRLSLSLSLTSPLLPLLESTPKPPTITTNKNSSRSRSGRPCSWPGSSKQQQLQGRRRRGREEV